MRINRLTRRGSRTAGLLISAVATATLLAACGGDGSSTGANRSESLVIAENEVPATFDPAQADNSTVNEVVIPAYDSVLSYDGAELGPQLAESWTVAPDGRSVSLVLRNDVTFHDGTPLTAEDVAYTLDRLDTIDIGVAAYLTAYESSTVVDEANLTINLSEPDATFVPGLSRVYVVNKALVEQNLGNDNGQAWLSANDAGSGPYKLTGYVTNQAANYEKYEQYWGGFTGQAQFVEFRYLSDAATESAALKSGDVDIAMDIAPAEWASFESDPGFTVDQAQTNVGLYTFFNMDADDTKSKPLREAVASAYNYPEHVQSILFGAGTELNGVLPEGFGIDAEGVTQPTYDLEKAKKIVADNNLSGTSLTMTYFKATTEMEQAATMLQSDLSKIGIDLKLEAVTYPNYVAMAADPSTRPDLAMVYAFPAFPDASAIMYQNFDPKFVGSGQNWGAYTNPAVTALVGEAQVETDQEVRKQKYAQAQRLVTADYATINMTNPKYVTVMNDRVQGYTYQPANHQTVDVYAITLK